MDILFFITIFLLLLICIFFLNKNVKENVKENFNNNIQPGPWGNIGTGKPWYEYPYILHNIEY